MYTYIVIDDEALTRKGTIKKLAPLGDEISCIGEAANGKEGLALIETLTPDFVILDMQMPVMDGMALLPCLSEKYPELPLIVISGYRDFEYAKQAISSNAVDYLLKPFSKEAIQNCVRTVLQLLSDRTQLQDRLISSEMEKEQACYDYDIQLLYNLIHGNPVSGSTLTSQKLSFLNGTHNLTLLLLHSAQSISGETLRNWLSMQGFGDLALYLPDTDFPHLGYLLLFVPRQASLPGKKLADEILDALIPRLASQGTPAIAGISNSHRDLSGLNEARKEASQALNLRELSGQTTDRFFYNQDSNPKPIFWTKTDEFLFRIEAGMSKENSGLITELFLYYKNLPGCSLADAKYHCYQLSGQCRLILNDYLKMPNSPGESDSMQKIVNHIFSLTELEEYYRQFFENICSLLKPQSVYLVDDVVEKIMIYIQRNYQKDLNQDFIASLFYLNRSYLSTLFKSRTGMKFVDYLNKVRLEKAMELLATSDRKMYQIARSVGYDNVKYFFRVFKKSTGLTPEQYRQQASEK
ncbi:MAG: response regulator [Lachnospiraceae bacterium]|nr:response regulator [Lachnospiraceae bacterium]